MATQNKPRVKNNPVFDPSELADLIHTPAVGSGVSSHLLRPLDSADVTTVVGSPAAPMVTGGKSTTEAKTTTVDKLTTVPQTPPSPESAPPVVTEAKSATVDKLTTVAMSGIAENWVSEEGLFISPAKVRPIRFPQDALSQAEQTAYYLLWQELSQEGEESPAEAGRPRLVQAGYDAIGRGTGFSKKTIQRIIEKLIEKGFVAIETPADIYRRTSTTYRVFPFADVRRRQLEQRRSYVARIGPGVVYAHRAGQ